MSNKDLEKKVENLEGLALALRKQIGLTMVMADSVRQALEALGVSKTVFDQIHAKTLADYEALHEKGLKKAMKTESDARLRQSLEDFHGKKQ